MPTGTLHSKRGFVRPIARSRTLRRVAILAMLVGAYSTLPLWKEQSSFQGVANIPAEIHAVLTLVLGCLLVFRTRTAHERWWEARTLWGDLVSVCRNLGSKLALMVRVPDSELDEPERVLIAFPFALRDHLRNDANIQQLPGFEDVTDSTAHVPNYLTGLLYAAMKKWKARGWIDGSELRVIDADLRRLMEICGGCESIRLTRVASSYRVFSRQCVLLFLLTLPWGLSTDFGWWTIPLTTILAYFMLGLEIVAEHVEEPFGDDEDDLDLDRLCEAVDVTVSESFERAREARADATESP